MSTEGPDWPKYYTHTLQAPKDTSYQDFLIVIPQNGNILDFGCGSGRFACAMHEQRPDVKISVLDMHLDAAPLLKNANWIHKRYHMRYETFAETEIYDGIFSWASLFFEPPERHQPLFNQLSQALKPNGTLCFTFTQGTQHELPFHSRSEKELISLLENAGLKPTSIEYRENTHYSKHKVRVPTYLVQASKA